jgi:hypothetical protein
MKTVKFTMIIALCSVMIFGCAKKSSTPPHLVAVPKDAAIVMAFNAKQIAEKSGLNELKQYKFYSFIQKEIENLPGNQAQLIKDLLSNTRVSGLNLDNVFLYVTVNEAGLEYEAPLVFGVNFLIDDLDVFEEFLEKTELSVWADGRKITFPDMTIEWNDKIAVISILSGNSDIDAFNSDETKSILANELFKKDYSDRNDAYLFAEFNAFISLMENYSGQYEYQEAFSTLEDYKDVAFSLACNDEKGAFVATAKILPEEKAVEFYDKYYKSDFDSELYKYFPDKGLLALKFAIKPLDIYNGVKTSSGISKDDSESTESTEQVEYLDEKGNVVGSEDVVIEKRSNYSPYYDYQMKMFIEQYDAKITSILSSFTGDVIGSISEYTGMIPDFALAAGIAEGKESDVIALIQEIGFAGNPDGYYSLDVQGVRIYFAAKKNIAYITTSTNSVAAFLNDGYGANITSAKDFGKELKEANMYFYVNINLNDLPAIFKVGLNLTEEGRQLMPLLETLKSLNISSVNKTVNEFKIKFNGSDYSGKIILKVIDELLLNYLNL